MKFIIDRYSTDGSSLSDERCEQVRLIYELCESIGNDLTSYKQIQNEAITRHIFGSAKADSVIRTIFPLLKKIGFVSYPDNEEFKANSFFTENGKLFVLTYNALIYAKAIADEKAIALIKNSLILTLWLGIEHLSKSEYREHNIMLAIEILRRENEIYWNELLFILLSYHRGDSIEQAIFNAKIHRSNNVDFEYCNQFNKPIANTAYSYVRSFLTEAEIIDNVKGQYSLLKESAKSFINSLPHYGY